VKTLKDLLLTVVALAVIGLLSGCSTEDLIKVTYPEGIGLQCFPVTLELPPDFGDTVTLWEVYPPDCQRARKTYAQTWFDSSGIADREPVRRKITFLWELMKGTGGKSRFFIIRKATEPVAPAFTFTDEDRMRLTLSEGNAPVFSYVYGMNLKEGVPEDRRRSSYIHPVHGLDSEVLSDDFPEDHYHHRGIFWTWPQVFVGGEKYSLWDIRGIYQRFESWLCRQSGPVFARLGVQNGWYAGDRRVVDEKLWIKAYRAGEMGRIFDFELCWEAVEEPVTLLGSPDIKGYGGFSFRFAPFENPLLTTSGGVQTEDSNRIPFSWADFSANFEGRSDKSGAALFDHPENIDYPNGWCLRHYGFIGIAWPGVEPFVLQPGNPITARYRVLIHRGDAEDSDVARAYAAYKEPPQAVLLVE
jgi:hypothetical protein